MLELLNVRPIASEKRQLYKTIAEKTNGIRPFFVDCLLMVIRRVLVRQLRFTTFEMIITSKFWKMNKKQQKIYFS